MGEFWRRHKRKVYVTLGVVGSGYLLYKLYDARRRRISDLEKQLARERESEELIKAQIQAHFEGVQRIADSTTLPHVMHLLDGRLTENLDLTQLTERLIQGKGQPNTITMAEKLELWDKLKILSMAQRLPFMYSALTYFYFSRLRCFCPTPLTLLFPGCKVAASQHVSPYAVAMRFWIASASSRHGSTINNYASLGFILEKSHANQEPLAKRIDPWDMMSQSCNTCVLISFFFQALSLVAFSFASLPPFKRRQLEVTCPGSLNSYQTDKIASIAAYMDEAELIDKNDEQQFLACADYLSNYGLLALISNAEAASLEILKSKQLKEFFNVSVLHDTIIRILETLMVMRSPHHWIGYLMPEDAGIYQPSSSCASDLSHATKFDLLMVETRAVLLSAEFSNIIDISLRAVVNGLLEDVIIHSGENNLMSGMPLARLVPRIAHISQFLLIEPNRSRYIQIIRNIPEVERFFTVLYSTSPTS
ncbi:peroxin 3 [Striga asiatica]|uniref:Peroxin 3 n=1 Tax=Striga asiatica TaxID=4170 RepID=A0A5A7PJT4_STRAF|nr:peroxin 3 [Striga asiatica]